MKKLLRIVTLFAMFNFAGSGFAADRGTAEEAVAMVQKAVAYMKANGKEKTIAEVNNPKGQFVDRDLYISITDMHAKSLANGANPKLVGKDLIDLRDIDGKFFMRERLDILKTKNKGWIEYKWPNPVTKGVEVKALYFEKFDDLVISCGIYKS